MGKKMKISDFKMAEFFIRGICKTHHCPFVDLSIDFMTDIVTPSFNDGRLIIASTDKLSKTFFQIAAAYLQNIEIISGAKCDLSNEERSLIIHTITSLVRDLSYSKKTFPEDMPKETVELSLNRDPFVWVVMRSIICPAFSKSLNNVKIMAGRSALMDGAKYVNKGEHLSDESFVFSNLEIENKSCKTAYLLYEVIRAHGMDPRGIVHEIFTKQELWSKFYGLCRAAWRSPDAINDFVTTLSILSDEMGSIEKRLMKNASSTKWNTKTGIWSQSQYTGGVSTWWYLGLIEKLLEPARGSDWSGYYTMKPFTDELYAKIEDEKKRRGMKELPLELLLRIQSKEYKSQPDLIIQGLLSDNRVW